MIMGPRAWVQRGASLDWNKKTRERLGKEEETVPLYRNGVLNQNVRAWKPGPLGFPWSD
jgi:hypothetical protein